MLIKDNTLEGIRQTDNNEEIVDAVLQDDPLTTKVDEDDNGQPTEELPDNESVTIIEEIYDDKDGAVKEGITEPEPEQDTETEENTVSEDTQGGRRPLWQIIKEDLPLESFNGFITGEFLSKESILSKLTYILLLAAMAAFYITNRYYSEQEEVEINHLSKELVHQRTLTLVQFTRLTGMSRQSQLEQKLRSMGDSTLIVPRKPPFIIRVNSEE
ncbi:MAG: hypothetical protein J5486_04030 [Bacteroidaceae bacterium]|nr:hypothetical protein [Bacteroidaceae bacterium]